MTMQQMRDYISKHPYYKNSPAWRDRCQRMPERQVVAIYNKFRQQDYRKLERQLKKTEKSNEQFHQINMFEYMEGITNGEHEESI